MIAPLVSVIIPVGPTHAQYLPHALASVARQPAPTETIVVNDTGAPLTVPPSVQVLPGCRNVAANRNCGIAQASAPWLLCLDADDYLLSSGLDTLLRAAAESSAAYVYGDAYLLDWHGEMRYARAPDYSQVTMQRLNIHAVSALVPTACMRAVGGFDERVEAWEDWTPWLRLAMKGYCGQRVAQAVFVYRTELGQRRRMSVQQGLAAHEGVLRHYRDKTGAIPMAPCCGGGAQSLAQTYSVRNPTMVTYGENPSIILMEYIGTQPGTQTWTAPDGTQYRGGNNAVHKYAHVQPQHVDFLLGTGVWRVRPPIAPTEQPPDITQSVTPDSPPALEPGDMPYEREFADPNLVDGVVVGAKEPPQRGRKAH